MNGPDIVALLNAMGCSRIREKSNGWVTSTCPFARWTHGAGIDSNPSFGIKVSTAEKRSRYRCLACAQGGELSMLPFALQARGHKAVAPILSFIQRKNTASLGEIRTRVAKAVYDAPMLPVRSGTAGPAKSVDSLLGDATVPILAESELLYFGRLPPEVLTGKVMRKRAITPRTYEDWQIRWHDASSRIAIPCRNHQKQLVGIAGRLGDDDNCSRCDVPYEVIYEGDTEPKKKRHICPVCHRNRPPKYLHTKGFSRDNFLYGEHRVQVNRRIFLVEGQFDTVALHQARFNGLGIMGTYLSGEQIRKVLQWASAVVILAETDKAGVQMSERVKHQLGPSVPTHVQMLPEGRDADELGDDGLVEILGDPTAA